MLDRLRDWRSDARFGVVVLIVVAVVAGCGLVPHRHRRRERGRGGGVEQRVAGDAHHGPAATATTAPRPARTGDTSGAGAIAVHVAGAVTHPGVVELGAGTRVIDAVEAVGGALADGDLDRLNLAAKLADGQRVYVPKVGEADPGVLGGGGDAGGGAGTGTRRRAPPAARSTSTPRRRRSSRTLPGIGPTYAQSILAERQRRGGFTSVNELRSVRGIGDKRFAELAPLVTV